MPESIDVSRDARTHALPALAGDVAHAPDVPTITRSTRIPLPLARVLRRVGIDLRMVARPVIIPDVVPRMIDPGVTRANVALAQREQAERDAQHATCLTRYRARKRWQRIDGADSRAIDLADTDGGRDWRAYLRAQMRRQREDNARARNAVAPIVSEARKLAHALAVNMVRAMSGLGKPRRDGNGVKIGATVRRVRRSEKTGNAYRQREYAMPKDWRHVQPVLCEELESALLFYHVETGEPIASKTVIHLACRSAYRAVLQKMHRTKRETEDKAEATPAGSIYPVDTFAPSADAIKRVHAALAEYWRQNPGRRAESAHARDRALLSAILRCEQLPDSEASRKKLARLFHRLRVGWETLFPGTPSPTAPRVATGRPATLTV